MERQVHELKIEPQFLQAKLNGSKLFEIRANDRGYQKGDITEYWDRDHKPLPRKYRFEITYVTNYAQTNNYVVFGERPLLDEPLKGKDND